MTEETKNPKENSTQTKRKYANFIKKTPRTLNLEIKTRTFLLLGATH